MAYDSRRCLWFGTLEHMDWFPTPLRGADMSPQSWGAGGTLLNGGGYELSSFGSHRVYSFEWPESSSREVAQLLHSYANGTYGRGLVRILDPLSYDLNILPARVADPSMAVDDEGASMVYGLDPEGVSTSGWQTNMLPVTSAYYNLADIDSGFRGVDDATFIPIPTGYTLYLGAFYSATGSGGIFVSPQNTNGTIGTAVALTAKGVSDSDIVEDDFTGVTGVWLWLGKSSSGAATVTASALIGRLIANEDIAKPAKLAAIQAGPWSGGMGNSGVRFSGKPTWIANSPINGGRIGIAASFREVGSWTA